MPERVQPFLRLGVGDGRRPERFIKKGRLWEIHGTTVHQVMVIDGRIPH